MKSKLLTSIFVLYFSCFSYSSESNPQDFPSGEIDKKINKYNMILDDLKEQWEVCDNLWKTIGELEKNPEFLQIVNVKILCNRHEKIFWKMICLNDKIDELENKRSTLTN